MRFITRMADPLWRVWVTFGDLTSGQRYFSDGQFGGSDQALAAAIEFRDKFLAKWKIALRVYNGNGYTVKHSKNTTGAVGITFKIDRRRSPLRMGWEARNMVDGKQMVFGRSIRTHGYEQAWAMVAKVRQAHTGIKVPHKPPPPTQEILDWANSNGYDLFPQRKKKKGKWPFLD